MVSLSGGRSEERGAIVQVCSLVLRQTGAVVESLRLEASRKEAGIFQWIAREFTRCDALLLESDQPFLFEQRTDCCADPGQTGSSVSALGTALAHAGRGLVADALAQDLTTWFLQQWHASEVGGCLLVGGKSTRMGRAKHLIQSQGGITWAEKTVQTLGERLDRLVISGAGVLPYTIAGLPRVPDLPGVGGPIAGILAVLQQYPRVSWIVAACDMPDMRVEALDWLLSLRKPGVRGILPDLCGKGRVEPLLAYYDFRVIEAMQGMVDSGFRRVSRIKETAGIITPCPPDGLRRCWNNINTPKELSNST